MPDHVVKAGTRGMNMDAPEAKLWLTSPFAREWYADALREARDRDGRHPRRREIVFAVCCVESYLVEWVLIEVLNRDFDQLAECFPGKKKPDPDGRTGGLFERFKRFLRCVRGRGPKRERQTVGIRDRWKNVIKKLESKGKIANRCARDTHQTRVLPHRLQGSVGQDGRSTAFAGGKPQPERSYQDRSERGPGR